ncbi:MAG TPA: glycogen debranching N-terminal domain-containing protein [Caulobacteraceae bacterium]|jgi:glycogen debranching enzyme|nr:glycogen debranching N-terminal domain-containing protein [Caulobacteraceae bacterium]
MDDRPLNIDIRHPLVLKSNELALLTREDGEIPERAAGFGMFYRDTCWLSHYALRLDGEPLLWLMSSDAQGFSAHIDLTNKPMPSVDGRSVEANKLHLQRTLLLAAGPVAIDTLAIRNSSAEAVRLPISLAFSTTFESLFVLRGAPKGRRGTLHAPDWDGAELRFSYSGADGVRRTLSVVFSEPAVIGPRTSERTVAFFDVELAPSAHRTLTVTMRLEEHAASETPPTGSRRMQSREEAARIEDDAAAALLKGWARLESADRTLHRVMRRSVADVALLQVERDDERFTAAGLPWYLGLFGRDSLIPAIQCLAFNPDLCAHIARTLAKWQGTKEDDRTREQPGKILHELRVGEMAHLKEIDQTPSYAAVDSTPLFLIAIARHAEWTGSLDLFHALRPNIDRALAWMRGREAQSAGGYIEYTGETSNGAPVNQDWRDSNTGVMRADGAFPEPPLALVEVQGYAHHAKVLIARLLRRAGDEAAAEALEREAARLAANFEADFWMEEEGCYCLALEKGGRQVASVTSNGAQVLWTGIAADDRAHRVAQRMMTADMFSGWGVRTLSARHPRYDPLAYQRGSVWPFDNAFILSGFRRYGADRAAARVYEAMIDAACSFRRDRLPEFFAGAARIPGGLPTHAPRADPLQAWSAGTLPFMISEMLGLRPEGFDRRLRICRPMLPPGVPCLEIHQMKVAGAAVSLRFEGRGERVTASVLGCDGALEVAVEP